MSIRYVVVPQWQGSGSPRREHLVDGARAIRAVLPPAAVRDVAVPDDAGDAAGTNVRGYTALREIFDDHVRLHAEIGGPRITIGGDCGVDLPAIASAVRRGGSGAVAVLWIDAHCDLNSPALSPSGAFHGMVLRAALGDGAPGLVAEPGAVLQPAQLVMAGTRVYDSAERAWVDEHRPRVIAATELTPDRAVAAVEATGARSVYFHVDLDVLDPSELRGIGYPEPDGITADTLLATIAAVRRRFGFAGAGLTEFMPRSPAEADADLPTVRRVLDALAG